MAWTEEKVNLLKELWGGGMTTAQIGARLGFSKNAIIGKAHRLGLAKSRPGNAPNTGGTDGSEVVARAARKEKAGAVWAEGLRHGEEERYRGGRGGNVTASREDSRVVSLRQPIVESPTSSSTAPMSRSRCQWIDGDPAQGNSQFCGDLVREGSPYCERHYKKAYIRR